jgi:hypothetical protein
MTKLYDRDLLNRPCSLLNDHKYVSRSHMTCQNLKFHRTHEEEQDISSMLELINLANLDDKSEPSQHLIC